jgi:hypothetical protein
MFVLTPDSANCKHKVAGIEAGLYALYLQENAVEFVEHRRPHTRQFNLSGVMRGLAPRIHPFARRVLMKRMDCRVKPGNDDRMDCRVNPRIKSGGGNDELR